MSLLLFFFLAVFSVSGELQPPKDGIYRGEAPVELFFHRSTINYEVKIHSDGQLGDVTIRGFEQQRTSTDLPIVWLEEDGLLKLQIPENNPKVEHIIGLTSGLADVSTDALKVHYNPEQDTFGIDFSLPFFGKVHDLGATLVRSEERRAMAELQRAPAIHV